MDIPLFSELGGEVWRIRRFADDSDKKFSAFNPSISYSPIEGYVVLIRSSNYFFDPYSGDTISTVGGHVKNRMWMANLDSDWKIIEETMREIDFSRAGDFLRGPEDGRLYWRDGSWYILAVMKEPRITNNIPRIGTFKINKTKAELIKLYTEGDLQPVEKNWMPLHEHNELFDFVYSGDSVYKSEVGKIYRHDVSLEMGKNIRGGSQLWNIGDKYLAIIHETFIKKINVYSARHFGYRDKIIRTYLHKFATYDKTGKLVELSDPFTFEGNNIEFAAGLVLSGDDVIISYGYKDVAAYLGKIKLNIVIEMLKEVK
jgi:hypothetical protein